ncbi:MAG: DNA cytosine methyltransferase [Spirochaeta sp.]|nr:DNA cytosine methyltransferase [Spirochaeta sp.]
MPDFVRTIDLFCGAGGLSVGFEQLSGVPFKTVWANDFNACAAHTFNLNFGPVCRSGDIVDLLQDSSAEVPQVDVVIGGPPCQGFSLLNKQRGDDPRKKLWIPFMEVVRRSGARLFVMENVPQLLGSREHQELCAGAVSMGFMVWSGALVAADYGVPQTRTRAFIVGCMDNDPAEFFPPLATHRKPGSAAVRPWRTVADAIKDLPPPEGTEIRDIAPPLDLHFGRNPTEKSRARYRAIPEQGMNRLDLQRVAPELTPNCWVRKTSGGTDLFGRLWWGTTPSH